MYRFVLNTFACALALSAVALTSAQAHEGAGSRNYSGFTLGGFETRSLYLGGWSQVTKIIVQADGTWHSGMVEVYVNGDVKGSIYVPGNDPSYVVTIAETASSIEFRNTTGSTISIREVMVTSAGGVFNEASGRPGTVARNRIPTSPEELQFATNLSLPAIHETTALARRAMELVEVLEPFTNYSDNGKYMLPIKKAASRAYAKARANSQGSAQVSQALAALAAQIEYATPYIEDAFERDGAFEYATELLSLKETLLTYLR